jgi:phenylalanyl-tRNA synthetase beta chain
MMRVFYRVVDTLRRNTLQQVLDVRLFEVSKVFRPLTGEDLPREERRLTGLMYGAREEAAWNTSRDPVNFFDLKARLALLDESPTPFILDIHICMSSFATTCLIQGECDHGLEEQLRLRSDSCPEPGFGAPPTMPRTLGLPTRWCCRRLRSVTEALYSHGHPWLVEARLFDVYTGDPVPAGKRSLAFRLSYRDQERTLTDDLVNAHHQALVTVLKKELGAELR